MHALKGKKQSPEHIAKRVAKQFGQKRSKTQRLKISEAGKGKHPISESNRQKLRNLWTGRKLSEETKKKVSEARKGMRFSEDHRKKLSLAHIGKTAEKAGHWKGGRSMKQHGYIAIWNPNHPCADKRGYVLEHRLVMEAHLGRVLLPTEVVHHINGIKDDNRIENMMLFSTHRKHCLYEGALLRKAKKEGSLII